MDNGKYELSAESTLEALHRFLEWECPIIIKIHIAKVMGHLVKDTHYRNLFEIGQGSGTLQHVFKVLRILKFLEILEHLPKSLEIFEQL